MKWFFEEDKTSGVITGHEHIRSDHKPTDKYELPTNAMIFCLGKWDLVLNELYRTNLILDKLPRFCGTSPVYQIEGVKDWCFLHGGVGAPVIADTIETLRAFGVKKLVLVGLAGGFGKDVNIGDIILPEKVLSEEGTSLHYGFENWTNIVSYDANALKRHLEKKYKVFTNPTITTDAVYRQTFYKENLWRSYGCIAVDMEASAFVNLCKFYDLEHSVVLRVSDKHPMNEDEPKWKFGAKMDYRREFLSSIIDFFTKDGNVNV